MADLGVLAELANTFGAWSAFIGYLVWDRIRRDAREKEREKARDELAEKRIEADKAQASAMMLMEKAMGMLESTVRGLLR